MFQGPPSSPNVARQKKLYLIDLKETDASSVLKMRLVVDCLSIEDPYDIGGPLAEIAEDRFNFPLQSVESVTPVDAFTLLVGLDNNYPAGNGRVPATPDVPKSSPWLESPIADADGSAVQERQHRRAQ